MDLRKDQRGYLYEFPIMVAAAAVLLMMLWPALVKHPVLGKTVLVIGALMILRGLYYMIVTPGWQPSDTKRLRWPYSIIVFGIIACIIVAAVVAFIVKK